MQKNKERKTNIIIHGKGTSAGGICDNVTIHGEGVIGSDIDCAKLVIHGKGSVEGSVKAKQVQIHGSGKIEGHLKTDELVLKGYVKIHGDCSAETFHSHGGFQIDGLLNAGRIEIRQHGSSHVKEIGGEVIIVRRSRALFFNKMNCLVTETIEGDDIHLENTKANTVRGSRIVIGRGCEINLVEYRDDFQQLQDAKVAEHRRLGQENEGES